MPEKNTRFLAAFDYDNTVVYGPPSVFAFFQQSKMPRDVNIFGEQKMRSAGPLGLLGMALAQLPNLPFIRRIKNDAWVAFDILDKEEEKTGVSIDRAIISGRRIGTHWAVRWTAKKIPNFDLQLNSGISSHIYKKRTLYKLIKEKEAGGDSVNAAFFNDDWRAVYHICHLNDIFREQGSDSVVYGYVVAGITNAHISDEIRREMERRKIKIVKSLSEAVDDYAKIIQQSIGKTK